MIAGYMEGTGPLHALPAGAKLIGLAALSILILPVTSPLLLAALLVPVLAAYAALGRPGLARLRRWTALVPLLAMLAVVQALVASPGDAALIVLRIVLMVLLADLVTLSTRLQDMLDAIGTALSPLRGLGVDTRKLALAVALVLRFVPVLLANWQARAEAWRARSPRRPRLVLVGVFFVGALKMADQVAEALDARGFAARADERE